MVKPLTLPWTSRMGSPLVPRRRTKFLSVPRSLCGRFFAPSGQFIFTTAEVERLRVLRVFFTLPILCVSCVIRESNSDRP